jgi:hypothetical protein
LEIQIGIHLPSEKLFQSWDSTGGGGERLVFPGHRVPMFGIMTGLEMGSGDDCITK